MCTCTAPRCGPAPELPHPRRHSGADGRSRSFAVAHAVALAQSDAALRAARRPRGGHSGRSRDAQHQPPQSGDRGRPRAGPRGVSEVHPGLRAGSVAGAGRAVRPRPRGFRQQLRRARGTRPPSLPAPARRALGAHDLARRQVRVPRRAPFSHPLSAIRSREAALEARQQRVCLVCRSAPGRAHHGARRVAGRCRSDRPLLLAAAMFLELNSWHYLEDSVASGHMIGDANSPHGALNNGALTATHNEYCAGNKGDEPRRVDVVVPQGLCDLISEHGSESEASAARRRLRVSLQSRPEHLRRSRDRGVGGPLLRRSPDPEGHPEQELRRRVDRELGGGAGGRVVHRGGAGEPGRRFRRRVARAGLAWRLWTLREPDERPGIHVELRSRRGRPQRVPVRVVGRR